MTETQLKTDVFFFSFFKLIIFDIHGFALQIHGQASKSNVIEIASDIEEETLKLYIYKLNKALLS